MQRRTISSGSPYEPIVGYSRAVVVGKNVFVAGSAPVMQGGGDPPTGPYAQARRCLEIIGDALAQAGAGFEHVVRTRVYLIRLEDFEEVGRAHGEVFRDIRPANTTVIVAGLVDPRWLVEIEADAVIT